MKKVQEDWKEEMLQVGVLTLSLIHISEPTRRS